MGAPFLKSEISDRPAASGSAPCTGYNDKPPEKVPSLCRVRRDQADGSRCATVTPLTAAAAASISAVVIKHMPVLIASAIAALSALTLTSRQTGRAGSPVLG